MTYRRWIAATVPIIVFSIMASACAEAVSESPVDLGLNWLVRHQEPDGHWDSLKFSASKKCDTAATSLALLALLGAGDSEKVGEYKQNVRRAVAWLKSKQDDTGLILGTSDARAFQDDAIASALSLLAIAEAASMANVAETRTAAHRAVEYAIHIFPLKLETGDANAPVRYVVDPRVNTPIVGWNVMAFKSAKIAGLHVPSDVSAPLIGYLDSVEYSVENKPDREGFSLAKEYGYRKDEKLGGGYSSAHLTAIGCLSRQFLGWKQDDLEATVVDFIEKSGPPVWKEKDENVNLSYWWIATLCAFQQGGGQWGLTPTGNRRDIWQAWNEPLKSALIQHQSKAGDDAGSWYASESASREWGRVGQTALGCLCLEIYTR